MSPTVYSTEAQFKPPVVSASSGIYSILVWFKLPLVSPTVYSTEAQFKAASSVC